MHVSCACTVYVGTNLVTDRICRLGAESADCLQIRPTKTSLHIRLASSADSPNVSADTDFKCSVCRFDPTQAQNLQTRLRTSWNESADESNLQIRKHNLQIRSALVGTVLCGRDESADPTRRSGTLFPNCALTRLRKVLALQWPPLMWIACTSSNTRPE